MSIRSKQRIVLHLFRRDLRLLDNTALEEVRSAARVHLGFVFDHRQVGDNPYKGETSLSFMLDALVDLAREIEGSGGVLNFWVGDPAEVLESILTAHKITEVSVSADYTPFSKSRDEAIAKICEKSGVSFKSYHDALLTTPGQFLTKQGSFYKIFTPFYNAASRAIVALPAPRKSFENFSPKLLQGAVAEIPKRLLGVKRQPQWYSGGREAGLSLLKKFVSIADYKKEHDFPSALGGFSCLSSHNKFGTLSIREVYAAAAQLGRTDREAFVRALYWRDFFTLVLDANPHVLGSAYNSVYNNLKWENDETRFERWCEGQTGFPLVDAGMRELNATGFMHNRVRMVTASFLVKCLHIDWRWGEKYFAQRLVDYDPAVNNGNWQWIASTGCDAQPYFRIFNPWIQQKKFDPEALYIKKWVSELSLASASAIHALDKRGVTGYQAPMIDYKKESRRTLMLYKTALAK